MKTKTPETVKRNSKKRTIAKPNCSTRLFVDNYREVQQMIRAQGSNESEVLREIVSDWFRMKRIQALGRDQTEDPIRRIYERVIEEKIKEHITPLTTTLSELKKVIGGFSTGNTPASQSDSQSSSGNTDVLCALDSLRSLLEQTGSDLGESNAAQISQLEQLTQGHLALQAIGGENFAVGWSVLDLIIRFMVEINLHDRNKTPDEVEDYVRKERTGLRLEGLQKISGVEDLFDLPKALRIGKRVLPQSIFQQNGHESLPT